MNDVYSQYREPDQQDNILSKISAKALEQQQAELDVAKAEEQLKKAQATLRHIAEVELPTLMDEAGQQTLTTKDNIQISLTDKIRASIPAAHKYLAFKWLEERGYSKLIKSQFVVEFDRENRDWAKNFESFLGEAKDEAGFDYKKTEAVHASTLSSFINEILEEGVQVPFDIFGVYKQRQTKLKIKG